VVRLCRYLGVSSSGFYDWQERGPSARALEDQALVEAIKVVHVGHKRNYGAPRVHKTLKNQKLSCSKRRVNRLMRENGIQSTYHASKPGRRSGGNAEVAANVLAESPKATAAGQQWAGDMTYLKTAQGPIYMAAILDLFNREVIGWGFSRAHDADLITGALEMSLALQENNPGCLFHSDQGSEYRSNIYQETLKKADLVSSMSRAGTPTDNAFVESFFGTLKNELVHQMAFGSYVECAARVIDYVEFYNEERLHSSLGYMSPKAYQRAAS
jgi:transposase InsO family protein